MVESWCFYFIAAFAKTGIHAFGLDSPVYHTHPKWLEQIMDAFARFIRAFGVSNQPKKYGVVSLFIHSGHECFRVQYPSTG
jgi:hypothetical protein